MIEPKSDPFVGGWNGVATERVKSTLAFLEKHKDALNSPALDIGGKSPLGDQIADTYRLQLQNTTHDLDTDDLEGEWQTILCFEVLEHLGSPLRLLQQIKQHLGPNGTAFLSTPLVVSRFRPTHWLLGKHHVFEMDRRQIEFLLQKAGLVVEDEIHCRYLPLWKSFLGVRPIIKLFTDRCILLRLKAKR